MFRKTLLKILSLAALCQLVSSCAIVPEIGSRFDRGAKADSVLVNLTQQRAYLMKDGRVMASSPISSGREGKDTPTGNYQVIQKSVDHRSSIYGNYVKNGVVVKANIDNRKEPKPPGATYEGTPMPYFLRFYEAYGLHAGHVPGYPASSGCVRLPQRQAKRFFNAVDLGTPVKVVRERSSRY